MKRYAGPPTNSVLPDADAIRRLRRAFGLSRGALARETKRRHLRERDDLHVAEITIKRAEGGSWMRPSSLRALAGVFGVPYAHLVQEERDGCVPEAVDPQSAPDNSGPTRVLPNVIDLVRDSTQRRRCEFEIIAVQERERVAAGKLDPRAFWANFWKFQCVQYREWRQGRINAGEFEFWMASRRRENRYDREVGGISFRTAWREFRDSEQEQDFAAYMEAVFGR